MPGKANRASGITTLKAETLERTAPHGPLHPRGTPNRAILPLARPATHFLWASWQHLTSALKRSPLANSFGQSHLAPAPRPWAQAGYFQRSSAAGGRPRFALRKGLVPRRGCWRPAGLTLIPQAAAELPAWAAHARPTARGPDVRQRLTQTSPAMCAQPGPGEHPGPR